MKSILSWILHRKASRRLFGSSKRFLQRSLAFPIHARRKSRLEKLDMSVGDALPRLTVHLDAGCGCRRSAALVEETIHALAPLVGRERIETFAPTAMAIDLDLHPDFMSWRRTVSRATDGKYHRSANRARRLGYVTRRIGNRAYARSIWHLRGSKPRRSKGVLVWASILDAPPWLVDTLEPAIDPDCPRHWKLSWGVFRADETGEERLAAVATLIRAGDVVWIGRLIGHGDALVDGVTKMVMFDMMEWILARTDPAVVGIRAIVHGHVEEGGNGLFDWKRYIGFRPVAVNIETGAPPRT